MHPPVVVLAFPRSGTTLVSRLLDAHPEVSCPPETNLLSACGRFLRESGSDGPPLGVLSGMALAGVPEAEVFEALRRLVFGLQGRLARGKQISVVKSAFDIFYLDEIEGLLAGHVRFLCMVRQPLDVIASVKDLVDRVGHYMPELREHLLRHDNPIDAFAAAWIDRAEALLAFLGRHPEDALLVRYEDLVDDPVAGLARVADFIGIAPPDQEAIAGALSEPGRIGLGDWKVFGRRKIDAASIDRWRRDLPRPAVARLVPRLEPSMAAFGYATPGVARRPDREEALRQFQIAMRLRLSMTDLS